MMGVRELIRPVVPADDDARRCGCTCNRRSSVRGPLHSKRCPLFEPAEDDREEAMSDLKRPILCEYDADPSFAFEEYAEDANAYMDQQDAEIKRLQEELKLIKKSAPDQPEAAPDRSR